MSGPAKNLDSRSEALAARMDALIGYVLLAGVVASAGLVAAGLAWHWLRTGQLEVHYGVAGMNLFQFLAEEFGLLVRGDFRPRLLVSLGIGVLLLTPYVRVAASLAFFLFVEGNLKYAAFTAVVLLVLSYSLFLR